MTRTGALGARTWTSLVLLGFVGQLAWTVENMYLNVFVYDTITDDPNVIATMVAVSAVAATLATLLVGALSDRVGRRRVFIAAGYVLWGITTAAFGFLSPDTVSGLVPAANAVVVAAVAVVALDAVMSLFGSGANDAAFQAWVTDSTEPANRGRVESVLAVMPLLSMLVVFGAFDGMTRAGQWRGFFVLVGAIIVVVGVVSWFLVRDRELTVRQEDGYLRSVVHGLRPSAVRENPGLYLALSAWTIWGISTQVFLPYLIIYLQRYLRIDGYAIVLAVVLLGASVVSVIGGRIVDRVGKVRFLLPAVAVYGTGLVLMAFARGMVPAILAGLVMMSGFMLVLTPIGALVRDYSPPDRAGHVQGLRMVFAILVPMLVGPFIGAAVIRGAAETYSELGVVKQVPSPLIFVAAAVVLLLILVPVTLLHRKEPAA
ncbi:MFS transporter [Oerskovia enterophila]|uniref:Major facilitator superfamily protein n=1 Tax=Oerskovia enterophila TaxID=43678 RepID=A0ABX2Y036_9CELL|nr:MFS transporter [Oerskovia enterophila]OCI29913.1 major facilitator superfamily protein [Oerskovia enterophila]